MSISTTLPPAIVKPITENTRPSGRRDTTPIAVDQNDLTGQPEPRERRGLCDDRLSPRTRRDMPFAAPPSARSTMSGSSTATSARSRRSGRPRETRRRRGAAGARLGLSSAPGPERGAARGSRAGAWRRGAVHDRRDLVERHPEHVVQHERQSFRRLELLEHDEQRQSDRVGDHRSARVPVGAADHGIRHVALQGILPARCPRSQHVQAHARDDRRQPSPQVLDGAASVRLNRSSFLDGVLASLTDPSMRYATARTCGRCSSNCSASPSSVGIITFLQRGPSLY